MPCIDRTRSEGGPLHHPLRLCSSAASGEMEKYGNENAMEIL